jgi:hypothetical protein
VNTCNVCAYSIHFLSQMNISQASPVSNVRLKWYKEDATDNKFECRSRSFNLIMSIYAKHIHKNSTGPFSTVSPNYACNMRSCRLPSQRLIGLKPAGCGEVQAPAPLHEGVKLHAFVPAGPLNQRSPTERPLLPWCPQEGGGCPREI